MIHTQREPTGPSSRGEGRGGPSPKALGQQNHSEAQSDGCHVLCSESRGQNERLWENWVAVTESLGPSHH